MARPDQSGRSWRASHSPSTRSPGSWPQPRATIRVVSLDDPLNVAGCREDLLQPTLVRSPVAQNPHTHGPGEAAPRVIGDHRRHGARCWPGAPAQDLGRDTAAGLHGCLIRTMLPIMPTHATSIDYEERLSTLLATYERMERATASKFEWIELEVAVNQAFIDVEQVFLNGAAQQASSSDDARRAQEHMDELVSLRERIEGQVALASARNGSQGS